MTEGKTKLKESSYPLDRAKTVFLDKLLSEAQRELFLHAANRFEQPTDIDWSKVCLMKLREVIDETFERNFEDKKSVKKEKKKKK